MVEKAYKDLSPIAKKGISKFSRLSSRGMKLYGEKFKEKTGMNPNNVMIKEKFFSFVARSKLRRS